MAIIPNPAQGAGRQAFTSMLSIFDLIGTARSLDLRKTQADMDAGNKALKSREAIEQMDVQDQIKKLSITNPNDFDYIFDSAKNGKTGPLDDALNYGIKKGLITPTGVQVWRDKFNDSLKLEADTMKAIRDGKKWINPIEVAKTHFGLTSSQIRQVRFSDPEGFDRAYTLLDQAYNNKEIMETIKESSLYNSDTQGNPIYTDGKPSLMMKPNGMDAMTGRDNYTLGVQQWIKQQGIDLRLPEGNPFGKFGTSNAASPLQGKGEAEARIVQSKMPTSPVVLKNLIADIPGINFQNPKQTPYIEAMVNDANAALIKDPTLDATGLRKALIDSGEKYKFIVIDPNKESKRGFFSKALFNPTDFKVADNFTSKTQGVTPIAAVGQEGTFDAQGNQIVAPSPPKADTLTIKLLYEAALKGGPNGKEAYERLKQLGEIK